MVTKTKIKKQAANIRYKIANIASDGKTLNSLELKHEKIIKPLDLKSKNIEYKKLKTATNRFWKRARKRRESY